MNRQIAEHKLYTLLAMYDFRDDYGECVDADEYYQAVEMAVEALRHPLWISCEDDPPEDGHEVLIYNRRTCYPYIAWRKDGVWYTSESELAKEEEPVEWMEIPKPSREEENGH